VYRVAGGYRCSESVSCEPSALYIELIEEQFEPAESGMHHVMPWLMLGFCSAQDAAPPTNPIARFGTTVVKSSGLRGDIYDIPARSRKLPNFRKLTPIGAAVAPFRNRL
jgi:hypothetical protein